MEITGEFLGYIFLWLTCIGVVVYSWFVSKKYREHLSFWVTSIFLVLFYFVIARIPPAENKEEKPTKDLIIISSDRTVYMDSKKPLTIMKDGKIIFRYVERN